MMNEKKNQESFRSYQKTLYFCAKYTMSVDEK